ncbi:MAG: Ribonucleotide reductase of class II (coenzyme B12-dependent), partial [uncultured Rubellimicrobium sp.]
GARAAAGVPYGERPIPAAQPLPRADLRVDLGHEIPAQGAGRRAAGPDGGGHVATRGAGAGLGGSGARDMGGPVLRRAGGVPLPSRGADRGGGRGRAGGDAVQLLRHGDHRGCDGR